MRFIKSKKAFVLLATLVVAVVAAIAAYAYFTSAGTGSGTASVGTAGTWVVTVDAVPDALVPGPGGGRQVTGTVMNGASGQLQLNRIDAYIKAPSNVGTDPDKPACTAADFEFANSGSWQKVDDQHWYLDVNQEVGGGFSYPFSGLAIAMFDRHDTVAGDGSGNQDNCKNATVNLEFDAS